MLGLSPFLENKSLTPVQLVAFASVIDDVVNRNLTSSYLRALETSSNNLSLLCVELVPFGFIDYISKPFWSLPRSFRPGTNRATNITSSLWKTPSSLELISVQERNHTKLLKSAPQLRDHRHLLAPFGYSYDSVYKYLIESFETIDTTFTGVPFLLEKPIAKLTFSSRVKLYKELEDALFLAGLGKQLNLGKLPEELLLEED